MTFRGNMNSTAEADTAGNAPTGHVPQRSVQWAGTDEREAGHLGALATAITLTNARHTLDGD